MSYPQYPDQQQAAFAPTGEVPLWAPHYGASLPVAVRRFFKKYATFSGRASRSEYWWFTLANVIVITVLYIVAGIAAATSSTTDVNGSPMAGPGFFVVGALIMVWALAIFVPSLALTVRRLHDGNFSGWLILLNFVPFLGALGVFILTLMPANPAGQVYDQPTGN